MGNANADHLIERILSDATDAAAKITADADAVCADVARDRDRRIEAYATESQKRRDIAVKELLDGAETRARLDGKKELLAAKRAILGEAFDAAYRALCSSASADLVALYGRILNAEAENGDTVAAAEPDRAAVAAAIAACQKKLTLSPVAAPCERGFLLYGKSYEKDCSLRAILSVLRDAEETEVARILFS